MFPLIYSWTHCRAFGLFRVSACARESAAIVPPLAGDLSHASNASNFKRLPTHRSLTTYLLHHDLIVLRYLDHYGPVLSLIVPCGAPSFSSLWADLHKLEYFGPQGSQQDDSSPPGPQAVGEQACQCPSHSPKNSILLFVSLFCIASVLLRLHIA